MDELEGELQVGCEVGIEWFCDVIDHEYFSLILLDSNFNSLKLLRVFKVPPDSLNLFLLYKSVHFFIDLCLPVFTQ